MTVRKVVGGGDGGGFSVVVVGCVADAADAATTIILR